MTTRGERAPTANNAACTAPALEGAGENSSRQVKRAAPGAGNVTARRPKLKVVLMAHGMRASRVEGSGRKLPRKTRPTTLER